MAGESSMTNARYRFSSCSSSCNYNLCGCCLFQGTRGSFLFCGRQSHVLTFFMTACHHYRCCIWNTFILVQRAVSYRLKRLYKIISILKSFCSSLNKLRSDIRRLTATASSPLYSLYNEAIDGIVMIRAFGQDKLMMATMKVLNNRERATYLADWTGKSSTFEFLAVSKANEP